MLRTTKPLQRFHEYRVWFNPQLVGHKHKFKAHRREIYRANWTGRPGKLTQAIDWHGTRRPVSSHPKAHELKFQRDYMASDYYVENLKQPNSFFREQQYPDVTTMDGILPRYIDMPAAAEAKDKLQQRLRQNRNTARYLDEEWKHAPDERAKFSWLDYESTNPKIFYDVMDVKIWSFDRNRLEHFHDYVDGLCRHIGIKVDEAYALPNEEVVYKVYDNNNVLQPADKLTRHYRVIQMRDCDILQINMLTTFVREAIPESVELSIEKHSLEVHNQRYQKRHDIEMAQRELEMLTKLK